MFLWTDEHNKSFKQLVDSLVNAPILAFPDFKKEFKIETDACDNVIGAIISQNNDGMDQPIAYFSRSLNKAERRYSTTEKEALGIVALKTIYIWIRIHCCDGSQTFEVARVNAKSS